jgi:hypothetical protein
MALRLRRSCSSVTTAPGGVNSGTSPIGCPGASEDSHGSRELGV